MKRIIIGSNSDIAREWIKTKNKQENLEVTRMSRGDKEKNSTNRLIFNIGEYKTENEINSLCQGCREFIGSEECCLIIFSWCGTPRSSRRNNSMYQINIYIMINTMRLIKNIEPTHIILISSAGALYESNSRMIYKEDDRIKPTSEYGIQKSCFESKMEKIAEETNSELCILRLATAYGYLDTGTGQGVVNQWCYDALSKGRIRIFNTPSSQINFISFKQIAEAIELTIQNKLRGIYNVGSKKSTSLGELMEEMIMLTKSSLKLEIQQEDCIERYMNLNIEKFANATGKKFEANVIEDMADVYTKITSKYYTKNEMEKTR